MFKRIILIILFVLYSYSSARSSELSLLAESLFKKYSSAIYQVQSISTHSNEKYSIGSGFQISKQGFIVTNYHVISDVVISPTSFFVQVIQPDGTKQSAEIIDFDVIHDIAIIKIKEPQEIELPLGNSELNKGTKVFSIGNPEDVGMMIIEGNSNGYMEKALYKKVLTSLPLNPGMSGGPTLDEHGNVVGINVMTSGNSLSFLVPVEYLSELWKKIELNEFKANKNQIVHIEDQLIAQEGDFFNKVMTNKWQQQRFESFMVPTIISNELTCWGAPGDHVELWMDGPYLSCNLKDDLFISSSVSAHTVLYNYSFIKSRSYNPYRFHNLTDEKFIKAYRFDLNYFNEEDANNFECTTDRVAISSRPFWVSTCVRKLKRFTKLYDMNIRIVSLGDMDRALMLELTVGAVTRQTAKAFMDKFYKEITWVK